MDIYNWIIANKVALGGAGIAIMLGGQKTLAILKATFEKVKAAIGKVKNERSASPVAFTAPTVTDGIDLELADQQAIRHLRDRASAMGNAKLVAIIKEADSIFFDIHTGTNVPTSVESAVTLKE